MPRKYNLNIYRPGETSEQYIVSTVDNTGAGSYTCSVTISAITSPESAGYSLTATGLFFDIL